MNRNQDGLGLIGKTKELMSALEIEQHKLNTVYKKRGFGPRITYFELIHELTTIDKATVKVDVMNEGIIRSVKLRFELTDRLRHPYDQYRGKRDLSMIVIFLRIYDGLGRICQRVARRIGLVSSDIQRQLNYFRKHGYDFLPDHADRMWRKRRRAQCHRVSHIPSLGYA